MNQNNIAVLILAAGKGSRMKSVTPKVLHKVGNKSMILHCIDLCKKLRIMDITVVLGQDSKIIKKELPLDIKIAIQKKQKGTADAVLSAKNLYLQ